MNSNVMPSVVQMERETLRELTTQVKETLATNIQVQPKVAKHKRFGIVDLWNCQRNVKTGMSMRKR
jgi:hypothetical protein